MSMLRSMAAAIGSGISPVTFSGALSASGTGSATVTGTTRTATVPSGNSGTLRFANLDDALGQMLYSKNGGAMTAIANNDQVTLANTDTLQFEGRVLAVGEGVSCDLTDMSSGGIIESVLINRTA